MLSGNLRLVHAFNHGYQDILDSESKLGRSGCRHQRLNWKFNLKCRPQLRRHANGKQGITTQTQKIVVNADGAGSQQVLPNAYDFLLNFIGRRSILDSQIGPRIHAFHCG